MNSLYCKYVAFAIQISFIFARVACSLIYFQPLIRITKLIVGGLTYAKLHY